MQGSFFILNSFGFGVTSGQFSGTGFANASLNWSLTSEVSRVNYAFNAPEPSSLALLASGLLAMAALAKKKREPDPRQPG
jgi:hypothetical protein